MYFPDGAAQTSAAIDASSEPWRPMSKFIIKDNPHVQSRTITSVWEATMAREAYRTAYAAQWNATSTSPVASTGELPGMVDVILCPVGPGAAPLLETARYWGYTAQWNILDYPAVVFPVTRVGMQDAAERDYVPRNELDRYNHELYTPERYLDAPVGLQLVGRRYEDEKVIKALEILRGELVMPFPE